MINFSSRFSDKLMIKGLDRRRDRKNQEGYMMEILTGCLMHVHFKVFSSFTMYFICRVTLFFANNSLTHHCLTATIVTVLSKFLFQIRRDQEKNFL